MARIKRRVVIPMGILLAIAAYTAYWVISTAAAKRKPLEAAGTLEAVDVDVGSIMVGRIININYDEGDRVSAGAIVATLDAQPCASLSPKV